MSIPKARVQGSGVRFDCHDCLTCKSCCVVALQVIRSTYELEVAAKTGCCLSEVRLKQPIFINDPQPHAAPPTMQPPPGWAPQVRLCHT